MITIQNAEDMRDQFICDLKDNRAIALFGAGVSMVAPTGLPSGKALKELIVNSICNRTPLEKYLDRLLANSHYQQIVPEVMFQEIHNIIGDKIYELYQVLRVAQSNPVHHALAAAADRHSCSLFTTNFDELVERYLKPGLNVCHLHGTLSDPAQMGILITQIGLGVSQAFQQRFFKEGDGKRLYVFGYSGNDKDIIKLINRAGVTDIVWLMRDRSNEWELKNLKGILNKDVAIYEDDLGKFFDHVSLKIGFPSPPVQEAVNENERSHIAENFKQKITTYESFGCLDLLFYINGDYQSAVEVCREALAHADSMSEQEKLKLLIALADDMRTIGTELVQGLALIDSALEHPDLASYPMEFANLLNIKGLTMHEMNHPIAATLEPFIKAEELVSKHIEFLKNNTMPASHAMDLLSRIYNNIGLAYRELAGDPVQAERYHKRSLALKRKIGHLIGICRTNAYLCLTALAERNNEKFRYRFRQSTEIIEKYDLFRISYELYQKTGEYLCEHGNRKKGLQQLNMALHICQTQMYSEVSDQHEILAAIQRYS
jgi:tetratricopeptide (TPR) repeat protein